MPQCSLATPTGTLVVTESGGAIVDISWGEPPAGGEEDTPLLREARRQLARYFAGEPVAFDLPLRPSGTPFQQAVWAQMRAIPYGEVRTYGDLARALGSAPRAVGTACGRNPIPIMIPCHRVVGGGGRLTGFSGGKGVETKQALLAIEGAVLV